MSSGDGNNANLTAAQQRTYGVGANYAFGPATVGLLYTHTQDDNLIAGNQGGVGFTVPTGTNLHLDNYEINGKYALTPALSLNGAYTFTDGKATGGTTSGDPKWHTVSLQADYIAQQAHRRLQWKVCTSTLRVNSAMAAANVAMINTLSPVVVRQPGGSDRGSASPLLMKLRAGSTRPVC